MQKRRHFDTKTCEYRLSSRHKGRANDAKSEEEESESPADLLQKARIKAKERDKKSNQWSRFFPFCKKRAGGEMKGGRIKIC